MAPSYPEGREVQKGKMDREGNAAGPEGGRARGRGRRDGGAGGAWIAGVAGVCDNSSD
jgi:hypothetical protein